MAKQFGRPLPAILLEIFDCAQSLKSGGEMYLRYPDKECAEADRLSDKLAATDSRLCDLRHEARLAIKALTGAPWDQIARAEL